MAKYSLGTLLIVMAIVALSCAAVANWSPLWAEIMTTATVAILLVAVLLALVGRGNARTFAIGFAAVGAAYFLLTFVAPARLRNERLSTSRAIDRLFALTQRAIAKDMTTSEFQFMEVKLDVGTGRVVLANPPREFEDIGHCLWTLILALIGGVLAQGIQRTSRKEETSGSGVSS